MRKFIKGVFILITVVTIAVYLAACCTPFISPFSFWPMTFLALGFPLIATVFLIVIFVWLLLKWKASLALLVLFLIAGYSNLHATFGLSLPSDFKNEKQKNSLRILTWNVRYFDNNAKAADSPLGVRRQMINYIKAVNADVMMFQDYVDYYNDAINSNIGTLRDSLGYKYCYTTKDQVAQFSYGRTENGVAIYSKFPIGDSGKIPFENIGETIAYADVKFQNKSIRLFTTHLVSMGIHPHLQYNTTSQEYDSALVYGKTVSRTLRDYDQIHVDQAQQYRAQIDKSPYPVIVTGDFNSVPSSFVYHTIKGNLQDVFVKKGYKLGHTYVGLSKTLRIDYILIDPKFKVLQVATPKLYLSDHFPVVADVEWR